MIDSVAWEGLRVSLGPVLLCMRIRFAALDPQQHPVGNVDLTSIHTRISAEWVGRSDSWFVTRAASPTRSLYMPTAGVSCARSCAEFYTSDLGLFTVLQRHGSSKKVKGELAAWKH